MIAFSKTVWWLFGVWDGTCFSVTVYYVVKIFRLKREIRAIDADIERMKEGIREFHARHRSDDSTG